MTKITNPELLALFPPDPTIPDTHEVWQVSTKLIVPKGTDVEQLLADIALDRVGGYPVPVEKLRFVYTDLSKIQD